MDQLEKKFIDLCYEEAEIGLVSGEVPVGCVFVFDDDNGQQKVIAKSHNRSNEFLSALHHAEFNCVQQVVNRFSSNYLEIFRKTTVIITLEPCIMCCRMLRMLQIKLVCFGARNDRFGGAGSVASIHNDSRIKCPSLNCLDGLDSNRSIQLLQRFYEQTNENVPNRTTTELKSLPENTNRDDYQLDSNPIQSSDHLFKATYKPMEFRCLVRINHQSESDLELLSNEVHINQFTNHPNLIKIIRHFLLPDGLWYSIFPYSPFKSMDLICKPFGLPESLISIMLVDILNAVDYLHHNNIIHRAITGSHIVPFGDLNKSIKFVLTGLKYNYDMNDRNELQAFDYPRNADKILKCLSPEMLEQNIIGYNYKTDIYSIGILCCELANGIVPFDQMSPDCLLFYKIIGDTPRPLDSTCEEMKLFEEYANQVECTLQRRYRVYCKRKFSSEFQEFVNPSCLHGEQSRRMSAAELLEHCFIQANKQIINSHSSKLALLSQYLS